MVNENTICECFLNCGYNPKSGLYVCRFPKNILFLASVRTLVCETRLSILPMAVLIAAKEGRGEWVGGCQESNLKMLPGSKRGDRGMGGGGRGGHRAGRGHRDAQRRRTRGGENVCLQFTCWRVSEIIRTSLRPWSLHGQRVNVSCLCHGDNLRTLQHQAERDTQSNTLSHIFLSGESADSCTEQFGLSTPINRDLAQGIKIEIIKHPC